MHLPLLSQEAGSDLHDIFETSDAAKLLAALEEVVRTCFDHGAAPEAVQCF